MEYWRQVNMAYPQCWYQNESSDIRLALLYMVKEGKGMAYTHLHSGDIRRRALISDHHLVLYIGSGGTVEWHIRNVVSRMWAPISDFQYFSGDLVDKECHIHTVLASMSAASWLPYSLVWYSINPGSWIFILSISFSPSGQIWWTAYPWHGVLSCHWRPFSHEI